MDRETELAKLIIEMSTQADDQPIKVQAKELFASAGSREVAHAQQRVLESGMDLDELFVTWQQNRKVLPDMEAVMRRELPDNHLIQRVLAEHDMLLCFVSDLEDVNIRVQQLEFATSTNSEIRKLEHIVSHLAGADEHPEREDQVIYPELLRHGFPGPGEILTLQHQQLSLRLEELQQLVWSLDQVSFDAFKVRLQEYVEYIVPVMRRHIFIENNLILPLSLEVIDDEEKWVRLKELCDDIGYCGYSC
ncbi:MAG: hemerythrin domain-containing protein [Phycisphaerae bacterium]|jgi:hypothetical protein